MHRQRILVVPITRNAIENWKNCEVLISWVKIIYKMHLRVSALLYFKIVASVISSTFMYTVG